MALYPADAVKGQITDNPRNSYCRSKQPCAGSLQSSQLFWVHCVTSKGGIRFDAQRHRCSWTLAPTVHRKYQVTMSADNGSGLSRSGHFLYADISVLIRCRWV